MAATTIFRFVTIRNPRKPTDEELETGFVTHTDDVATPLMVEVGKAKQRKTSPDDLRAIIKRYADGNKLLRDPAAVEEVARDLVQFGEWLARNNNTLTVADIKKYLTSHPITIEGNALLHQLWSNLLVATFVGGMPETREAIIGAIRAAKLVGYDLAKLSDDGARRLAMATVVLPSAVQLNGEHLERVVPNPPAAPPEAQSDAHAKKLSEYQAAHDELSLHYRNSVEKLRGQPTLAPPLPKRGGDGCLQLPAEAPAELPAIGVLDEASLRDVSKATRKILEQLAIPTGTKVGYALKRLGEAATSAGDELAAMNKSKTRVVMAGGSLWAYDPEPATHAHGPVIARKGGRIDVEYAGMYDEDICRIKPLGIADYRRVEQVLWCYEPGEVAHIENVMIGETRERNTRFLHRTENTLTTETSEETTKERDTQTTDRFEIEKESEKVVKDDLSFTLGVQVQASYGVVKIQADTNFAYAHSSSESDKASSKYAKEVTDRALERVVKKTREEQIQKVIEEYEENNKHAFVNETATNVVGLYRWVNKIYQAKIVNYGKRLMFEFMVPEPGAFHLYAMTKSPIESSMSITKPDDPREGSGSLGRLTSHLSINVSNYAAWAALYDAKVEPIPDAQLTMSKTYNRDGLDQNVQFSDAKNDFKVPDGYEGSSFTSSFGLHAENHDGGANWITVFIGTHSQFATGGGSMSGALAGEDDFIPVGVMGRTRMYGIAIEVIVSRKAATYEAWQIKSYAAIMKGYEDKLAAYQTALAEAMAKADSQIIGTNPAINQQITIQELKKACIRLMDINCDPVASEAMKAPGKGDCDYPEFDCCEAMRDGNYVQFVEQAFEWDLITYLFYPYFWGRKCNWKQLYQLSDPDPQFLAFLQAGFARVIVPVRPGYQDAALRWLVDNQPWNGGSAPGVDSPMYLAIANELKEEVGEVDPSVEPWLITVPTTLTVLQAETGAVPGTGLPCPQGEDENHHTPTP
ncbi:MAG: hypothetical protein ABI591_05390 [Kofleriaceae bacterium]